MSRSKSGISVLFCRFTLTMPVGIQISSVLRIIPKDPCQKRTSSVSPSLRRSHELDLEAAAVGGLAVAAAGIVEVEDDFAGETDCRFAHVLRLEALRGLDHDLLGCGGYDFTGVHHRLDRIVHFERNLAVGTEREVLALDDDLASDVDLADLAALRMGVLDDAARGRDFADGQYHLSSSPVRESRLPFRSKANGLYGKTENPVGHNALNLFVSFDKFH